MKSSYHRLEMSERLISVYQNKGPNGSDPKLPATWENDVRTLLSEVFGSEENVSTLETESLFYMLIAARERCHREHISEAISVEISSVFTKSYPYRLVMGAAALAVVVFLGGTVTTGIVSINLNASLQDTKKSTDDTLEHIAFTRKSFDESANVQLQSLENAAPKLNEFAQQLKDLEDSVEAKQALVNALIASRTEVVSEVTETAEEHLAGEFQSQKEHIDWANNTLEGRITSLEDGLKTVQQLPHATVTYQRLDGTDLYPAPPGTTTDDWSILVVAASPGLKSGCCDRDFDFKPPKKPSKLNRIQHSGGFEGFAAYAVENPDHTSWRIFSYTVIDTGTGSSDKKREGQLVAVVLLPK